MTDNSGVPEGVKELVLEMFGDGLEDCGEFKQHFIHIPALDTLQVLWKNLPYSVRPLPGCKIGLLRCHATDEVVGIDIYQYSTWQHIEHRGTPQ